MLCKRVLLSSVGLVLCGGTPARAAEAAADDTIKTEIIVAGQRAAALTTPTSTGSRLGLTPLETPSSVSLVNGDTIWTRGDLTVKDAVTRAPGITTNANPGNGGTALVARGFGGQGSVLQLYDGIRLFPVAGTTTFPVDPWTVGRIEVLTGPASVLYGQGGRSRRGDQRCHAQGDRQPDVRR